MSIFLTIMQAAEFWLGRGVDLIPIQPNTKHQVAGFGAHGKRITKWHDVAEWFGARRCNLAVVVPDGVLCVDFDDPKAYGAWRAGEGDPFQGVIEKSRRGYHVWGRAVPSGQPVPGVEFKGPGQVVTVAPSRVGGCVYAALTDYEFGPLPIETLTAPTTPDREKTQIAPEVQPARFGGAGQGGGVVSLIRSQINILDVAKGLTNLRPGAGGNWVGKCPFHPDREAHFWVNGTTGLWGCHSANCRTHGKAHDVVNLIAESEGLPLRDVISRLHKQVAQ